MRAKFVADSMMGKLARWLRALGYDTLYFRAMADDDLLALARREGRILLTRDRPLAAGRADQVFLIESDRPSEQLKEVAERFGLEVERARLLSRCMVCNHETEEVPKKDVMGRVPPFVYRNHERFTHCPGCGRVYWRASHMAGIMEKIAEALRTEP